jgi:hypothetical protein
MRILRNIGLTFVVSLLILATGGFSIYHHFCYCEGESSSLFFKETCDHHHAPAPLSCCSKKEVKSCCEKEPAKEKKQTCHKGHCCQNISQFLKISDSFQPGLAKISLKPLVVASALPSIDIQEDTHIIPHLNLFTNGLPPPDTGRQIILALHQLKLDPHLV